MPKSYRETERKKGYDFVNFIVCNENIENVAPESDEKIALRTEIQQKIAAMHDQSRSMIDLNDSEIDDIQELLEDNENGENEYFEVCAIFMKFMFVSFLNKQFY